ncbi:MAG: hypothetical protein MHM6MM_004860 [Cercozoa sp. M6MM]
MPPHLFGLCARAHRDAVLFSAPQCVLLSGSASGAAHRNLEHVIDFFAQCATQSIDEDAIPHVQVKLQMAMFVLRQLFSVPTGRIANPGKNTRNGDRQHHHHRCRETWLRNAFDGGDAVPFTTTLLLQFDTRGALRSACVRAASFAPLRRRPNRRFFTQSVQALQRRYSSFM